MGRRKTKPDFSNLSEAESSELNYLSNLLSYFTDDYEDLAKRLTKACYTTGSVFIAKKEELLQVEGVTEKIADFISNFSNICNNYFADFQHTKLRIFSSEVAYNYFRAILIDRKTECIALMILNSHGYVLYNKIIGTGSINIVPVYIKEIIRLCIEYDTDTVLIAHNHPGGSPLPSSNDIKSTREIQLALEGIYVTLYDHIIIADGDYFSMRSSGLLSDIYASTDEYRRGFVGVD